ncbi:MAG TPA: hypothetical protein VFN74_17570 [Chloroflexota bacterium]|nr:hypothetical protein [Chloroflexota bacterium]
MTNVLDAVAGPWHILALKADGTVWGWGGPVWAARARCCRLQRGSVRLQQDAAAHDSAG